jgi:hypothetical protein
VTVAVQQRVVGADGDANGGHDATTRPSCSLWQAGECGDDEDDDGQWWWQSEAGNPEKRKVPQWEVLAANRVGWEAGLKKVEVNERDESE